MQEIFTEKFWAMGGYAGYVWTAFGLTLGMLAFVAIQSVRAHHKLLRDIRRRAEVGK